MNVILTSDFPETPSDAIVGALCERTAQPRIAWVPSHTDPTGDRFRHAEQRFQSLGLPNLELLDIDEECDPVQVAYLHEYDIVFLAGDDAIRGRFNANRSGLAGRLRQCLASGRTIVGAGGGALLLTPNVSVMRLQHEAVDAVLASRGRFDALGAVPYELVPHANRCATSFLDKVRAYSSSVEHDIIALADGGAIFHAGSAEACSEGQLTRYRKGTIIEP